MVFEEHDATYARVSTADRAQGLDAACPSILQMHADKRDIGSVRVDGAHQILGVHGALGDVKARAPQCIGE
jgi:hypothetical protein